jgi:tetratricopeptide (TPR) repeat protein
VLELQGARPAQRADLDALEGLADDLDDDALRAKVFTRRAQYGNSVSDYPGAIEAARRALALAAAAEVSTTLRADSVLGWALMRQGDHAAAQARADANLARARESGERVAEANALRLLAAISGEQENATASHQFNEQSLRLHRSLGDRRGEATDLNNLGDAEMRLGNYPAAATWLEQSLQLARALGHLRGECVALANLALVEHSRGDHEQAVAHGRASVEIARTIDAPELVAFALNAFGHALAALQRHAEAAESYDAALALFREMGTLNIATESRAGLARVKLAEGKVDEARAHVEDILTHLATGGSTDGTDQPLRIYLTCFEVLEAAHDPRADALLATMHAMFERRATKITDPDAQRMFRNNIAHNRQIAAAWAERRGSLHLTGAS